MREIQDHILLARAVRKKDREALALLHTKYYPHVTRYIAARLGLSAGADDLAQNVFVELLRGNGQYDGRADPQAYLFGIAGNIIGRYYRDKRSQLHPVHIESIGQVADCSATEASRELIMPQQLRDAVADAIARLPPKARQAIKLRFIDGLSSKEAAKKAECPLNVFYSRVYDGIKALGKLKDALESWP